MTTASLPSLLQRFFTERLITQQGVSPHTVAGYRDTFRLLFRFTTKQLHRAPSALRVEDLEAPFLERFLNHLERVGAISRARAITVSPPSMASSGMSRSPSRA